YLINNQANPRNLTSLIPKWGYEGLIKLREIPKKGWFGKNDMAITKLKEIPEDTPDYERTIFHGLFTANKSVSGIKAMKMIWGAIKDHYDGKKGDEIIDQLKKENDFE